MTLKYNKELECAERLLRTIMASSSPFHASIESQKQLTAAGFKKLNWNENWTIEKGCSYFVCPFDTTVIAFKVNKAFSASDSTRILTCHIDSPCLRIKHTPEHFQKDYLKLNTEVYGGAILNTWLDRPLSAAGRVCIKSDNIEKPDIRFVDFKKPLFVIPNLAIHLNKGVNEGIALNAQIDMLPMAGSHKNASKTFLTEYIADTLSIPPEQILSYELSVYNTEKGQLIGLDEDMILSPRIDNISSMQACLTGLIDSKRNSGIDIAAFFDHEEIGSRSKNGADSSLFTFTLERIYAALGQNRENYIKNITNGYMISLDVAHAVNPNHTEKNDITTDICINEGIALKSSSRQNYCGDCEMSGIILQLAEKFGIPCKINYLRSDTPGGSTLGPILSSGLPMLSADIGIPILAMHSAMETAGVKDQFYLEEFAKCFYGF